IYYFGIYRGVFCVDLMSDRLSLPHFYFVHILLISFPGVASLVSGYSRAAAASLGT
ncbi:unnamed protein product, partial [Porites evermanni]